MSMTGCFGRALMRQPEDDHVELPALELSGSVFSQDCGIYETNKLTYDLSMFVDFLL